MKFDAVIIGLRAQAGNPLSSALAELGWTVAMIERSYLGGTCINTGCTPTKTMIASAQVAHYARNGARWGVKAGSVSVDMPAILARKNAVGQEQRGTTRKQRRIDNHPKIDVFATAAKPEFLFP